MPQSLNCKTKTWNPLKEIVKQASTCSHENTKPPPLVSLWGVGRALEDLAVQGELAALGVLGGGCLGDEGVECGGGQHLGLGLDEVQGHHGRAVSFVEREARHLGIGL